jgi:hypothetical protein
MGDIFPADDHVAVFLVALSAALNDLLHAAKAIASGDAHAPGTREIEEAERLYFLRLSLAQIHEVRETISQGRKTAEIHAFLNGLPEDVQHNLERLTDPHPDGRCWIPATIKYVRNKTHHYEGKWGWDDLRWAMRQVADQETGISLTNEQLSGLRLDYADLVMVQHLTRKFPEFEADDHADVEAQDLEARMAELFQALSAITVAAQNFLHAAIHAYLPEPVDEPG